MLIKIILKKKIISYGVDQSLKNTTTSERGEAARCRPQI
jgi:hypothetical protein